MSEHKDGPFIHDFHAVCRHGHTRNFVWADDTESRMINVSARCVYCGGMQKFAVQKYWQTPIREKYFKIR